MSRTRKLFAFLAPVVLAQVWAVLLIAQQKKFRPKFVVSLDVDRLTVEVSDDGAGGAELQSGGGLQGLADRLSVLGARLQVISPPGGGTTVRAVLPCA